MLRSQFLYEFLIGVRRFAAQLVIEVGDAQNDPSLPPYFQQQMQESNGIGASRHGYANALPGAYVEPLPAKRGNVVSERRLQHLPVSYQQLYQE
jgi:hypothetical protein